MVKTIKALPMFYRILQDEERAIFKEESIVSSVIITSFKKKNGPASPCPVALLLAIWQAIPPASHS